MEICKEKTTTTTTKPNEKYGTAIRKWWQWRWWLCHRRWRRRRQRRRQQLHLRKRFVHATQIYVVEIMCAIRNKPIRHRSTYKYKYGCESVRVWSTHQFTYTYTYIVGFRQSSLLGLLARSHQNRERVERRNTHTHTHKLTNQIKMHRTHICTSYFFTCVRVSARTSPNCWVTSTAVRRNKLVK